MPGWHAKSKDLVKDGKLLVAGIAPEQHGDRMALFLQWKGMQDMPVMLDSYNILGLKVVPITLLVDESGIIRFRNPSPKDLETFLALPPAEVGSASPTPRLSGAIGKSFPKPGKNPNDRIRASKTQGIHILNMASPDKENMHFQLGVAFRKRYDSPSHDPQDFSEAVAHWRQALALDPSNYIWRRRLQQYGPRLDKPYPFYNWVTQAREEITARGEIPHPLVAEPTGAELAHPAGTNPSDEAQNAPHHPDPDNKLPRETGTLFNVTTTLVPHTSKPDSAVRVFVETLPLTTLDAKWNDEAGLSSIRVLAPNGWTAHPAYLPLPPAGPDPLHESRRAEFELRRTKNAPASDAPPAVTLQVFTHVCHGLEGTCELVRRDITFPRPPAR